MPGSRMLGSCRLWDQSLGLGYAVLLVQQIVNGLMIGGLYALVASGLSLTMGVLRLMNLSHAVTISIAGILGVQAVREWHLPFPVLLLYGALAGGVVGALSELVAFGPLRRSRRHDSESSEFAVVLASLALLFIFRSFAQNYIHYMSPTLEVLSFPRSAFAPHLISIGPIDIRLIAVVILCVSAILTASIWWGVTRTTAGRAVQAIAADHDTAGMLGINVPAYTISVVALSGALAGISGILITAAYTAVDAFTGDAFLLRAFAVIVLGGIGSLPGAFVGGLVLGLCEALTVHYFGSSWVDLVAFSLLLLILVLRPQGLFGKLEVDRA